MFNNQNENVSAKIVKMANIIWIIDIVLAGVFIVLGIIAGISLGFGIFLIFLLSAALILFGGYVNILQLLGFAELIQHNTAIARNSYLLPRILQHTEVVANACKTNTNSHNENKQ